MLHDCTDDACVESRYRARLAELRDESFQAASPAAYAETRPFPAEAAAMEAAQNLVGKTCSYQPNVVGPVIEGFAPVPKFLPVVSAASVVVVQQTTTGAKFAFLVASSSSESSCQIRDVVALPANAQGDGFLQCSVTDPDMSGFGVRNLTTHRLEAFWSVNERIERVAIGVLGIEKRIRCRQPETGE